MGANHRRGHPRRESQAEVHPQSPGKASGFGRIGADVGVQGYVIGSRFGQGFEQPERLADHQMTVEECLHRRAELLDHRRSESEVGHVEAVHDVEVKHLDVAVHGFHLRSKLSQVGGQHRRSHANLPAHAAKTNSGTDRPPTAVPVRHGLLSPSPHPAWPAFPAGGRPPGPCPRFRPHTTAVPPPQPTRRP